MRLLLAMTWKREPMKGAVTVGSVEPAAVILAPEGEQADTPVQVATAAMVVVFHMEELLVRVVLAVAVVVQLFPYHQGQAEVLAFRVKEEMAVAAVKVQILEVVVVVVVAPVAAMV
jgi:hypothetical protein